MRKIGLGLFNLMGLQGVWAPRIAQMIGADLPITARRSNLWVAKPAEINPGE